MGFYAYLGACAGANAVALLAQHFIAALVGADKDMEKGAKRGLFRDFKHPLTLYFPLFAPSVQAVLTRALAVGLFGSAAAGSWTSEDGMRFAIGIWASTSLHGIWMDYCTFQLPISVLIRFIFGSLVTAAISGAFLRIAF
jgi:hypothetical protein